MHASSDIAEGLLVQPWASVSLGNASFVAKACFRDTSYGLLISDLDLIWYEEVNPDILKQRSQELNKRLKAAVPSFFRHLRELICPLLEGGGKDSAASFTCERGQSQLIIHVRSELSGVPFYWDFYCSEASVSMVSRHLVRPFLSMNLVMQQQTEDLMILLERKDAEIQDYKENGAVLSRGRLETDVFNKETFMEEFLSKKLPESCSGKDGKAFTLELRELYTAVVKQEVDQKRKRQESGDEKKVDSDSHSSLAKDRTEGPSLAVVEMKQERNAMSHVMAEPISTSVTPSAFAAASSVPATQSSLPAERVTLKQKKKKAKGLFG